MLIEGDPIASDALMELSHSGLGGDFVAWPTHRDTPRLKRELRNGYYAANLALFNCNPNLDEDAVLGVGVYIFESEQYENDLKEAFVALYGVDIGLVKQAQKKVELELSAEEQNSSREVRRFITEEVTNSLAKQKRRLLGGYAVVATETTHRYTGFVYCAKEFLECYQFAVREAVLKGALDDRSEEFRKSALTINNDLDTQQIVHGHIARKLLTNDQLQRALDGDSPE